MKISKFTEDKINEVEKSILSLSETPFKFEKTLNSSGSTGSDGFVFDVTVTYQFFDSIKEYYKPIDPTLDEKVKVFQELRNGTCEESFYVNKKYNELFELLKDRKVGFIEINKYEKGTNISFSVRSDEDYEIYDNIPVSLPGISETVLTIGKEYYISNIRRGMKPLQNGNYIDKTKHKLISIDYSTPEYKFYFENIDMPITAYTRGHIRNNFRTTHRLDYMVIETFLGNFIKNVLTKCADEVCLLETDASIKNNAPLYEAIREVTSKDFIPKIREES